MLSNIRKQIVMVAIITISILVARGEVKAADFNSNLNNIKGQVTPEQEQAFIKADKEYLTANKDKSQAKSEIQELEKELSQVKNDYVTTSNQIKIYSGNTALKNNAIRTAIVNRQNLIKGSNFNYDETTKYMMDRDYHKEQRVRKTFTQSQLDRSLQAVVEIIENLNIDKKFLSDTTFVISPYQMDGINGYTLTRSSGKGTVVISNQNAMAPLAWIEKSIKSTTLHEIGHVFYNKNQVALKENNIKIENDTTIRAENLDGWKASSSENFAEDFRIFASNKLGSKSFEPMKKKTNIQTDEKQFASVMESMTK